MTVPIGIAVMEAISLYEQPSNSRRTRPRGNAGQSFESAGKALAVVAGDGEGFRRHARLLVQFFVEFAHELHRAVLLQPGIAGIAHNLQKPGSCVAAVEPTEKRQARSRLPVATSSESARLLKSHLARLKAASRCGKNELFKARAVLHIQHVRTSSLVRATH